MTFRRVEVEWVDSAALGDGLWMDASDLDEHVKLEKIHCRSVGLLLRDEHDLIAIAHSLDRDPEDANLRVMGVLTIPRRAIISITDLAEPMLREAAA